MSPGSEPLSGRSVVLGVSGGIAAYKAAYVARLLVQAGARVRGVMTASAREFLGSLTLQAVTGAPVFTDLFSAEQESEIGHIAVADAADLVIVAPATANTLARLSAGLADDALSAVVLATRAPTLLAPSMNMNMWTNGATQANVRRLMDRGFHFVGPGEGYLACNWTGPGRLAEPADILRAAEYVLAPKAFAGKRLLVVAGPTREYLDPVRFLSNPSTGRMGLALADIAAQRGAEVTLVLGPSTEAIPPGIAVVRVVSADDMCAAVEKLSGETDAVIMAAAVADYRPAEFSQQKIKKAHDSRALELVRTPDILARLGSARGSGHAPLLVGFAAETENLAANARGKLLAKGCDLVVANDVSKSDRGFAVDSNEVLLVHAGGEQQVPLGSKRTIAGAILDKVLALLDS